MMFQPQYVTIIKCKLFWVQQYYIKKGKSEEKTKECTKKIDLVEANLKKDVGSFWIPVIIVRIASQQNVKRHVVIRDQCSCVYVVVKIKFR